MHTNICQKVTEATDLNVLIVICPLLQNLNSIFSFKMFMKKCLSHFGRYVNVTVMQIMETKSVLYCS